MKICSMQYDRLVKHLQSLVHFGHDDMEVLTSFIEPVNIKKKEYLFRQGEICRYVGFVDKGCLRYFFTDEKAHEHILYFAFEEWWVGDLNSFYMNEPSPNSLQALEPCEMFLFSLTSFEGARKAIPCFDDFITQKHRKAYSSSQQKSFEARAATAEEKYIKLVQSSPGVFQRVPQHYIASYLGITPESLSRIRKKIAGQ
jgi:CRP-like cAMP-binding protein